MLWLLTPSQTQWLPSHMTADMKDILCSMLWWCVLTLWQGHRAEECGQCQVCAVILFPWINGWKLVWYVYTVQHEIFVSPFIKIPIFKGVYRVVSLEVKRVVTMWLWNLEWKWQRWVHWVQGIWNSGLRLGGVHPANVLNLSCYKIDSIFTVLSFTCVKEGCGKI